MQKKYAKEIGKDIIGSLEINYWTFMPNEDGKGTHVTHVMCSTPNGSMPDFAVKKMTEGQAKSALNLADYIRKKKKEEPSAQ